MARKSSAQALEVWLDADFLSERQRVGTLSHDHRQVRFEYDPTWLREDRRFALDPELKLDGGAFFPDPKRSNFGIFLDSCPDRWGQTLMDRREAIRAKDEGRNPRSLTAWDYLLGVQDATRMGALRFRLAGTQEFLDNQPLPAPPVTSLRELAAVASELTRKHIDDLDRLGRWLAVLVAPGASLGGTHPKANFTDRDGSLWIAKFPSRDDDRDHAAWEKLVHDLARSSGIRVPRSRLARFNSPYRTFCVQRFDRRAGRRLFFASAMGLLERSDGESGSYLELAELIATHGAAEFIEQDLAQLFRRVAFNIMAANRDDHLRNHGFIRSPEGWRLSDAFDMNPSVSKEHHVLAIDDSDPRPSVAALLATADFYRLDRDGAQRIVKEVAAVVSTWKAGARRLGIAGADIELTAPAFSAACG